MGDNRQKDKVWNITDEKGNLRTREEYVYVDFSMLAVLMDIRDELKRINNVLNCPNALAIPRKLDRISRNTAKPRKPKDL